jgi:hypothetical protein
LVISELTHLYFQTKDLRRSPLIVVHGAAPGTDTYASDWVAKAKDVGLGVDEEKHPADWNGPHRLTVGFRRNAEMVAADISSVLGFLSPCIKPTCPNYEPHLSHGTADCLHAAVDAGLTIRAIRDPSWAVIHGKAQERIQRRTQVAAQVKLVAGAGAEGEAPAGG